MRSVPQMMIPGCNVSPSPLAGNCIPSDGATVACGSRAPSLHSCIPCMWCSGQREGLDRAQHSVNPRLLVHLGCFRVSPSSQCCCIRAGGYTHNGGGPAHVPGGGIQRAQVPPAAAAGGGIMVMGVRVPPPAEMPMLYAGLAAAGIMFGM
jgi:hypothetical protein